MLKGSYRVFRQYLVVIMIIVVSLCDVCQAKSLEYLVKKRIDGGYSLEIRLERRVWRPITAEGIFPLIIRYYEIDIVGKGDDWGYRNQKGFFYPMDKIQGKHLPWDLGYAWVDAERKYLYLNLYWVSSPDDLEPSDINGRYRLTQE